MLQAHEQILHGDFDQEAALLNGLLRRFGDKNGTEGDIKVTLGDI
jgi:hypothetical protein